MTTYTDSKAPRAISIWWFAFGYFACYLPYSALTKAVSSGWLDKLGGHGVDGFELLPISVGASVIGMFAFITAMGWWKFANRGMGGRVPMPTRWTLASGICTSAIIGTTTLAYTFDRVSIVFMMLLMRGGVLIIAPLVDAVSGRKVKWFSAIALLLSLSALFVAFWEKKGFDIRLIASIDVAIYLASYFVRLQFMSRCAKSTDTKARTAYFVEEQMVAAPFLFLVLVVAALIGHGEIMLAIRAGFVDVGQSNVVLEVIVIGLFSQGTGIFGGLILLDRRENTFCVPVNRSSSIMAGVLASTSLWLIFDQAHRPSYYQLAGAGLIILAIVFLALPSLLPKRLEDASS